MRVPRADRCLWPIPDDVSNEDAVFVADILPTGFIAVQRAGVGAGDVGVVLGCGPVGLMALLCAVRTARRVIAVDAIRARRELAEALGAILGRSVGGGRGRVGGDRRHRRRCRDRGVGLGRRRSSAALELVRPQGVVSVVGAHFEPDFPLNNALMFEKEITLTFSIGNPGRDRERLLAMIADGVLQPSAVISDTVSIDEAAGGLPRVRRARGDQGRLDHVVAQARPPEPTLC